VGLKAIASVSRDFTGLGTTQQTVMTLGPEVINNVCSGWKGWRAVSAALF